MSNWDTKFLKKGLHSMTLLIPAESHVLPNDADLSTISAIYVEYPTITAFCL